MQIKDIEACLVLHRTSGLSNALCCKLLSVVQHPKEIVHLESSALTALEIPLSTQKKLHQTIDRQQLETDVALIKRLSIQLLTINCSDYPELLKEISDPPAFLYVRGDSRLLNTPQLAMVGSRHVSRPGAENAFRFARECSVRGFTITSGLALGVDAQCHQGALSETGKTIAVLGTGVDVVYPFRNTQLFDAIVERGALVSEFPLGTGPRRSLFPKRNRLISGMSLGVLLVEAALQSGSLITARCAMEQNREVYAIPGSIHGTGYRGCHAMIRQGAKLVEKVDDIMEELSGWLTMSESEATSYAPTLNQACAPIKVTLSHDEQKLLALVGYDPTTVDQLQQVSCWRAADLLGLLTQLELKGVIENRAGCYQRII